MNLPDVFRADVGSNALLGQALRFLAAGGIAAVFGKEIANSLAGNNEKIKKITKKVFMTFIASILAINALFEAFPKNAEGFNDLLVGALGVAMAIGATELAIKKFRDAREV